MKACVKCEFYTRTAANAGNGQMQMMGICLHPDLQDPVEGTPLPCQVCRTSAEFCGIKGLKWKAREEVAKPKDDSNVIMLA